jgi:hypothetical protein
MVGWGKLDKKIIYKNTVFLFQSTYLFVYGFDLDLKNNVFNKKINGEINGH